MIINTNSLFFICMYRISQKYLWIKTSCGDRFHPHGNIVTTSIQPFRSIGFTSCRYKTANLNSKNYYELLGVERTATQKEIKQAFFKLSKEYHPDSNSTDKSLHNKFVKINEAFSILSKQSSRITYDQSFTSISRSSHHSYPRQSSSSDWSNTNFGSRSAYERRSTRNDYNWGAPHYDKSFYEMFRRRMEYDRQRSTSSSYHPSYPNSFQQNYFGAASVILIIIGFGMFIHALQWRMMQFSDPQYAMDPRTRHNRAYREWQRLSALKDAEYHPIRSEVSVSPSTIEEE
ncbi:hypothetical protein I4U23_029943 [Adineta vaga]|nr:hypothetical protein I4U23_029943 [Adineta vaga]